MKIFDHNTEYTDAEWLEFFRAAETPIEVKRRLTNFFYGGMNDIDRDKQQLIASGFTPVITVSTPKMKDPSYWKELWKKDGEETIFGIAANPQWQPHRGTVPISYETYKKGNTQFEKEYLNQLTTVKLPGMDKIRWRYRSRESVKSTRWNRNHTKQAEFYYFWNIKCRSAKMYIPLEHEFDLMSAFKEIPVPILEVRMPEHGN